MSIVGILSSGLFGSSASSQNVPTKKQQLQQEFQQLGQDLQAGNLTAAQSDFASLEKGGPQANATSGSQNSLAATPLNGPLAQQLNQLQTDLQAGNLTAAQSDANTIQQSLQNGSAKLQPHHHHRFPGGKPGGVIDGLFDQLGQALQAGNLTSAQQAYTTLQQDFQQFAQVNGLQTGLQTGLQPPKLGPVQSGSSGLSVSA